MPSPKSALYPPRALVIGAGPMADFMHLPILAKLCAAGALELTLVCDLDHARAATARKKFGFKEDCGDAVGAIARGDIDVVYIFASAQLNYEYGMLALSHGKHLFVEKPVAPSFACAQRLAGCAGERGLIAVGGHNRRFYRSLAAARARAGLAGWRYAEAVFHKPMLGQKPQFGARSWLSANGIHALDALVFLMGGLPEQMTAFAGDAVPGQSGTFSAIMRWHNGSQGVFLCNNNAGSRREEYVLHAPSETCTVTESALVVERGAAVKNRTPYPPGDDSFVAEHTAFLEAVRNGSDPPHSLANIAPSLFLCELIESGFVGRVALPRERAPAPATPVEAPPPRGGSILVAEAMTLQPALARLLPHYRLVSYADIATSAAKRTDVVAALLGRGAPPLTAEMLNKLPQLTIVGIAGLSVARYEPDILLARGIKLINASAAYASSVAEFALGLAILGRRRAFISHEIMRSGGWGVTPRPSGIHGALRTTGRRLRPSLERIGLTPFIIGAKRLLNPATGALPPAARDLGGATVGLIGWGANARAFAQRLCACAVGVIVYSEHAADDDIQRAGAIRASLDEVLAADIVSLHRGLTDRTRHALGTAELARLRPGAVLINIARGALIDSEALLTRLRQGDIFACLDTYEQEPLPASHPLRRLPNVFLTSHIAGGSSDMHAAAVEEVVRKVADFLAGGRIDAIAPELLRNMT
ncbi:MAG: hypothetical protein JWM91_1080 [Rhodospirillales bacterium]|nr:hypothetical protein [Rhodospirillales bacterium]